MLRQSEMIQALQTGQGTREPAAHTGILAPPRSGNRDVDQAQILDALRARRVFASEDKNRSVVLSAQTTGGADTYLMGDIVVPSSARDSIRIEIVTENKNESEGRKDYIEKVELIGSPGASGSASGFSVQGQFDASKSYFRGQVVISSGQLSALRRTPYGEIYFYARVKQGDDDVLYSAPVWIRSSP